MWCFLTNKVKEYKGQGVKTDFIYFKLSISAVKLRSSYILNTRNNFTEIVLFMLNITSISDITFLYAMVTQVHFGVSNLISILKKP